MKLELESYETEYENWKTMESSAFDRSLKLTLTSVASHYDHLSAIGSIFKTVMAPRKPPPLSLSTQSTLHKSNTIIQFDSPVVDLPDSPLQLSSPDSSSSSSPIAFSLNLSGHAPSDSDATTSSSDAHSDDISKDLEMLEKLRKSVQKNLRLRPIKSSPSLPKVNTNLPPPPPTLLPISPPNSSWRDVASPTSSTSSVYYTPMDIRSPPFSARYVGPEQPQPRIVRSPSPPPNTTRALEPAALYDLLQAPHHPLLIDTRPAPTFIISHLTPHAINLAIPSLILKRYRKPNSGGFGSIDALRQFITTEHGKKTWDEVLMGPSGHWNGSVVVFDEEMNERDRENGGTPAWALIPLIVPLLHHGSTADYLKGGLAAARLHPRLRSLFVSDEPDSDDVPDDSSNKKPGGGLFQLDTSAAARSKVLPQIDHTNGNTLTLQPQAQSVKVHSPLPMMPTAMSSSSENLAFDSTPSPPPSQLAFRRPPPPRKPSTPNLRRIDTKSAERLNNNLPKLHIRAQPTKAATLSVPPTLHIPKNANGTRDPQPHSPSHLNLMYSNHSPPGSATRWLPPPAPSPGVNGQSEFLPPPSPYFASHPTTPRSPGTPMPIPSPKTARPDFDQPPTTEDQFPVFTISAILPNFLYLGPELTTTEHVKELKGLGVKRIINIAAECDDDHGLGLRGTFERYFHIPMRDIVEEENITRGVREACDILGGFNRVLLPFYYLPICLYNR